jgi:AraC-like DNA-binding protein
MEERMQTIVSGRDYYLNGPYAKYMQMVSDPAVVPMRHGVWPAGHFPDPPLDSFNLQLALASDVKSFACDFGAGKFANRFMKGDFHLAPPNVACDYCSEGPVTVLAVHLSQDLLADLAHDSLVLSDFGRLHADTFRDGLVETLMTRLWQDILAPNIASQCFADSARMAIVAALASKSCKSEVETLGSNALSAAELRRALEYADMVMDCPLLLKTWAAQLDMTVFRFSRSFKNSTGIAPHQYLIRERLQHVHRLICESKTPLSEIALVTGFSSQAHMTRLFKRQFGYTPGKTRNICS